MVCEDPTSAMNKDYRVFVSEEQLYGRNPSLNHRIREKCIPIYGRLFECDSWDSSHLYPVLKAGSEIMAEKLKS